MKTSPLAPADERRITFGEHSHWAQPWRSYMQTTAASVFVDGTGINFNLDAKQAPDVAEMLARHGIHHARIEIGWGSFDYHDEGQLDDPSIAPKLLALRKNGIRPLILLNANSGQPCPLLTLSRTIVSSAALGARTITFKSVDGIIKDYTGLSDVGAAKGAARILVTGLNGNVATLSQPLPVALRAGTTLSLATLKYRPFGVPGSSDFQATIKGWKAYAANVARVVRADLGTTGKPDGGFDIEVWNELSFGSEFLSLNNYYVPASPSTTGSNQEVWGPIVAATASLAESSPGLFSGVMIGDGFANTIPWPASSTEPPRIGAIDKHPYKPRLTFPAADSPGTNLNAAMQPDPYVPAYTALFPEYGATFIQTETLVREMGPFTSSVYGTLHGRYARVVQGHVAPVPVWITEVNISPGQDNPAISVSDALAMKAKTTARYFCFFLNKGVTQLDLYAASDSDIGLGIVRDNFLAYAEAPRAPYPPDDKPYVSPALQVTGRIVAQMNSGLDRNLTRLRPLRINSLASTDGDGIIFKGDGTALHPDLRAVDVFAFLPFQVNAHRFVIPYYVMTRDVMSSWPEASFDINISGFSPRARFSAYDPLNDTSATIVGSAAANGTRLKLRAGDFPKLLIVDEGRR